ncbi:pentapeptide repeat-containing protein [Marinisporobacter balticus]|uniref:Pentapeptide repeat protein n=1 Tax=Marinisporobacter balticus TaxID=2018667 RepID=A0A4R2KCX9_9FIRM|nr:pentapeptide repeat-containing protein [Marinisporobacter balticus]TCO68076.1 pentapeptide repeat protein [Marinisporobacter balticus]
MTREEALIDFEEAVKELLQKYEEGFHEDVRKNQSLFKDTVIDHLKSICEKVCHFQKAHEAYKVKYFQFSILRTSIVNKTYTIYLNTYNQSWYLDDDTQYIEIDLSFLFKSLEELQRKLYEKSKPYIGKINKSDIEKIILRQAIEYNQYIAHIARLMLQNIDEEDWFEKVQKPDVYCIRWGAYQDQSELIFQMDTNKKTTNDFLEVLKLTNDEANKDALVYTVFKDSEILDTLCIEKNMMFANFKGSTINDCSFKQSMLLGANFKNTILKNVNFYKSNLRGATFVGATFKDISFENAQLEGAMFLREDVPFLHLSPSQLQDIYIEGEW